MSEDEDEEEEEEESELELLPLRRDGWPWVSAALGFSAAGRERGRVVGLGGVGMDTLNVPPLVLSLVFISKTSNISVVLTPDPFHPADCDVSISATYRWSVSPTEEVTTLVMTFQWQHSRD